MEEEKHAAQPQMMTRMQARAANVRRVLAHKLSKPLHVADEMLHPFYFGIAAMELAAPYSLVAGALAVIFALNFVIGASGGPEA